MSELNRNAKRIVTPNLISYVCLDEGGVPFDQGMGRTLNLSLKGLQLETDGPISSDTFVMLTLAIEESLARIKGRAVYCRPNEFGLHETGIRFIKSDSESFGNLIAYLTELSRENDGEATGMRGIIKNNRNLIESISGEHSIITNYILELNAYLKGSASIVPVLHITDLLELLEKDLEKHFAIEESIIFRTAKACLQSTDAATLVDDLTAEHPCLLAEISDLIRMFKKQGPETEKTTNEDLAKEESALDAFLANLKQHIKTELTRLFSAMEESQACKDLARKYLLHL